jgi:hypothetical protein
MRRAESDVVSMLPVKPGVWNVTVPEYIFVEQGKDRRRLAGTASITVTVTDKSEARAQVELTYTPPGDDTLPTPPTIIEHTPNGAYRVSLTATTVLNKQ